MKQILIVLLLGLSAWQLIDKTLLVERSAGDRPSVGQPLPSQPISANDDGSKQLGLAFKNQQSDLQVKGRGRVTRLLKDDLKGSRHQRFILQLSSGQTLLVAHNIDLAPKILSLQPGDLVEFYGEYEWNSQGGVIHWTHRDPNGNHPHGWLRHRNRLYQ